jgi:hypothetical protein
VRGYQGLVVAILIRVGAISDLLTCVGARLPRLFGASLRAWSWTELSGPQPADSWKQAASQRPKRRQLFDGEIPLQASTLKTVGHLVQGSKGDLEEPGELATRLARKTLCDVVANRIDRVLDFLTKTLVACESWLSREIKDGASKLVGELPGNQLFVVPRTCHALP